jgi:hypothetical protein
MQETKEDVHETLFLPIAHRTVSTLAFMATAIYFSLTPVSLRDAAT